MPGDADKVKDANRRRQGQADRQRLMTGARPLPVLATLDDVVATVERSVAPLYVRFATAPPDGLEEPSVDGETGLELPGLSVNPLTPPNWWRGHGSDEWVARRVCSYAHLQADDPDRVCLVVRGSVVDRGPDNEPLLGHVEGIAVVARAVVDESRRRRIEAGLEQPDDVESPPPWQAAASH